MGLRTWWADAQRTVNNKIRAEGVQAASDLLRGLAGSVAETEHEDLRRGLLVAAGFTSVLAASLRSGTSELAMIEVDGDVFPVDLKLGFEA